MKIESILKRLSGTTVELDGVGYHFKPETGVFEDPHVCEVENQTHMAKLLAIPEGYRLYIPPAAPDAQKPVKRTVEPATGGTSMPVIGGATPPAHPAPAAAEAPKPLTAAQKKAAAKAAAKAPEADPPGDDADQVREELAELDDGELEDEFERVKGYPVPDEMGRAAMIEAIATHVAPEA